jgi:hypothetical protein
MASSKLILLLLIFSVDRSIAQARTRFNDDAQVIRDVLLDYHVSGSLVFSGGCNFQDRTAQVPSIGIRRDFNSAGETLQAMLSVNSGFRVTQERDGLIRMVEMNVPTDILNVKIHHISFSPPDSSIDDTLPMH